MSGFGWVSAGLTQVRVPWPLRGFSEIADQRWPSELLQNESIVRADWRCSHSEETIVFLL